MLGQGAKAHSIEVQRFAQSAFSMANFFLKYFVRKNRRGGGRASKRKISRGYEG